MGRGFIELYDDDGFRYFVNIDKIVNVSVDNKRVWTGEDSTLCLLWAMLMDSYSRWRTTGAVFIETGEDSR